MTRVLAQYLSLETAALGVIEFALSFALILAALSLSDTPSWGADPSAVAALAVCVAFVAAGSVALVGLYRPGFSRDRRSMFVKIAVAGAAAVALALLIVSGSHAGMSRRTVLWIVAMLLVWVGCVVLMRLAFAALAQRSLLTRRVLVLGSGARAARIIAMLRSRYAARFEPVLVAPGERAPALETLRQQRIWGIVIATGLEDDGFAQALLDSKLRGARILRDTGFCEQHLGRIDLDTIDAGWLLGADGFAAGRIDAAVKRAMDIAVSLVLLLLTLPLMVLTALMIKLDSPGPVLYRQERTGLHGKPFTLLKFRSMRADAEDAGNPRWAQLGDPRITRVGSFIRPMRIDELPQLFNVLSGEMSMIGPRPERPQFVEQLAEIIPFYRGRAYVKPGLTGWAQVNFPYGASVEDAREKLAYDLYYVKNRSPLLDLLIMFSTVRVILFREGAR